MDLGSIFLILGLLILVGLFIARPIIERTAASFTPQEHEFSALMAERDRLLNALQELDFDSLLGKIPEADYPGQREALLQQGSEILRRLDAFQTEKPAGDVEARIEAAIAARRAVSAQSIPPSDEMAALTAATPVKVVASAADDDLESMIASRRRERSEKTGGFCPKCGKPVQKSDRFCPKCGATLA